MNSEIASEKIQMPPAITWAQFGKAYSNFVARIAEFAVCKAQFSNYFRRRIKAVNLRLSGNRLQAQIGKERL